MVSIFKRHRRKQDGKKNRKLKLAATSMTVYQIEWRATPSRPIFIYGHDRAWLSITHFSIIKAGVMIGSCLSIILLIMKE
jgi:hypothetical protein